MKNHTPGGRRLRFASTGQRLFTVLLFVVFAALVWAAQSGRYDREIGQAARWLEAQADRIAAIFDR